VKYLTAALCAACLAVGAGTLGLVLVPVLALAGGNAQTSDLCGIPADLGAALATIRQLESGNDYTAQAAAASASGAYQFLDSSWRTWSARAGYSDLYAHAALPHVQDAAAAAYVQAILDQWHMRPRYKRHGRGRPKRPISGPRRRSAPLLQVPPKGTSAT
jgi:hypothetical protein